MPTDPARLGRMLADVGSALRAHGVPHALAGGMAMAVHGEPRATKDLDFLIAASDASRADAAMRTLGFRPAIERAGFVRYVRHPLSDLPELSEWADLLLARHPFGLRLLHEAQAEPLPWGTEAALPVVSIQGLVLMKALAHAQDPGRLQDVVDIQMLLRRFSASIDRRALADAAAEIGDDVLAVLRPLLFAPDLDEATDNPTRL